MTLKLTNTGKSVISTIEKWIESNKALFVNEYYPYMGSSGLDYFINSISQFEMMLKASDSKAIYTIFRDPQFPICGIVDDEFVKKC